MGENRQEQIHSFLDQEAAGADMRQQLQSLGPAAPPPSLTARLRVIASHERQRRVVRRNLLAFVQHFLSQAWLTFDNMMRPLALPFAGGSLSAVAFFALLVPSLSFPHHYPDAALSTEADGTVVVMGLTGEYVPKQQFETPRIEPVSSISPEDANAVLLTIDERGRVSDYSVEHGELTPDLQNIIMFSQFTPATVLGLPMTSKIKVVQRPPARRSLRG